MGGCLCVGLAFCYLYGGFGFVPQSHVDIFLYMLYAQYCCNFCCAADGDQDVRTSVARVTRPVPPNPHRR